MNKFVIAGVVIVLALVGWMVFFNGSDDDTTENNTEVSDELPTVDEVSNGFRVDGESSEGEVVEEPVIELTAGEVAVHNTETDCWTIIDGKVYDITEYIPSHPGGEEILRACGGDGSTLFNTRTTEDGETVGSGTSHSPSAAAALAGFLLGDLEE